LCITIKTKNCRIGDFSLLKLAHPTSLRIKPIGILPTVDYTQVDSRTREFGRRHSQKPILELICVYTQIESQEVQVNGTVGFFKTLLLFGFFLGLVSVYVFPGKELLVNRSLVADAGNTYLGPVGDPSANQNLVKVQILIKDALDPSGVQVTKVEFNQTDIPLKPRDIYGNRGSASFQLKPGSYKLKWRVNRDKLIWPREIDHEEIVHISPRDSWIQIDITGNSATIN
jgi:hypothetical protein